MSKTKSISVTNFKAITHFEADFNGCTGIITGTNRKGKSSFLRGIIDRIRFIRPDVMVKNGEEQGKGELTLDTGERFVWEFDVNGKDKLWYYDLENVKHNVTTELGKKFFPKPFDIDKFIHSTPKEQSKQLQALSKHDFTDIEARYERAYNDRTEKNRTAELHHVKLSKLPEPPKVEFVSLEKLTEEKATEKKRIDDLHESNKLYNDNLRNAWEAEKKRIDKEVLEFNIKQETYKENILSAEKLLNDLMALGYQDSNNSVGDWINSLPVSSEQKIAESLYPKEPTYIHEKPDEKELERIDAEILAASEINVKAQAYKDFIDYKQTVKDAKNEAVKADQLVKLIEEERQALIEKSNFPEGVSFTSEGVTVNGLPLDDRQLSKSEIYIIALKIAAMNIGEVKTLYFDASLLSKEYFEEINKWANDNDLQLLIERAAWEPKELCYEIVEIN